MIFLILYTYVERENLCSNKTYLIETKHAFILAKYEEMNFLIFTVSGHGW